MGEGGTHPSNPTLCRCIGEGRRDLAFQPDTVLLTTVAMP